MVPSAVEIRGELKHKMAHNNKQIFTIKNGEDATTRVAMYEDAMRLTICAGQVTVAGLQHPALAVWCWPGPRHTSRVYYVGGRALPSEHSTDQQPNTAFQRPFILRADEQLCLQGLRNPAINGAQNPASNGHYISKAHQRAPLRRVNVPHYDE